MMIDNKKEYILCAAIHYDNKIEYPFMQQTYGVKTGFVICGYRHPHIIQILPTNRLFPKFDEAKKPLNDNFEWNKIDKDEIKIDSEGNYIIDTEENQGFLTSTGRFVDRKEAGKIAYEAGQIDKLTNRLFSEDIY